MKNLLVSLSGGDAVIKIPDEARVTFGSAIPYKPKENSAIEHKLYSLRVYVGTNLIGVFSQVHSFYEEDRIQVELHSTQVPPPPEEAKPVQVPEIELLSYKVYFHSGQVSEIKAGRLLSDDAEYVFNNGRTNIAVIRHELVEIILPADVAYEPRTTVSRRIA